MCEYSYTDRLSQLKMYSLQRRRECYCLIYAEKIVMGMVPNFSQPILCRHSECRGRSCIISHVNVGISSTLAYNSFRGRAIRLFNYPIHVPVVSEHITSRGVKCLNKSLNIVENHIQ